MTIPFGPGPRCGAPSTVTVPASGVSKPATMFNSVDLPQPDGPTMATNSPSATSRPTPSITGSTPVADANALRTPRTAILLAGIAPAHRGKPLEQARRAVEAEPDQADDDHARDDEVVAVAGVARVHDQIAEARTQRDHLGGNDDQPGDADADPHADDDLRQHRRDDDAAKEHRTRDAEVRRRAQVASLDRVHPRRRLH